jgi:hypothetical protein
VGFGQQSRHKSTKSDPRSSAHISNYGARLVDRPRSGDVAFVGEALPLFFLLFVAIATGALSAYAGRDELRHNGEALWRTESFLAYALFVGLVLLPTLVYFYVFHGDWFLFYWIDTRRAPWVWGLLATLLLLAASFLGFRLAAALCRASREAAARRASVVAAFFALLVWPLAWERLSLVGSHRQFDREYGLVAFFSSPAFYAGIATLFVLSVAFGWLVFRIDRQTRDLA